MSRQVVDERVVEMRFDNKQFERETATTMSTIDKLKQKLNFSGATKGLEDVSAAAKKVDMRGLSAGVNEVHARFSAMEIVGITALTNITNSAVNAGKKIAAALTIDPVRTGFQEYETQINAVQTILANTSHKGSTIDDVNTALEELNEYADMTIYNFTEMTRNIGTFTAAGIDLDTSVNAIQGIANLAAVSGSTSQQASTAMYQLSQALAAGTVKLMDWNSVVNAGMGGEVFQNALKETSALLGTGAEAAIAAEGSFRESLRTGWLTSEVLTETLKKFTTSGANEYVAEYIGESPDVVAAALKEAEALYGEAEAVDKAAEALAKKSGKNKDEIADALQMAKTATDAATKVKTFTQLWDVMKETAQSGWSQTWKILIGDFEEAKSLLTPLSEFFTGAINSMSDWRNAILESALGRGFASLRDNVQKILDPIAKTSDGIKTAVNALKEYEVIVDEIIGGLWGNGQQRWDKLTEAGYDWAHAQNLVNEKLGDGTRHTTKYAESEKGLAKAKGETAEAQAQLSESDIKRLETLVELSDAELKAKGYTEEQIAAFRELEATAAHLGLSLGELLTNLDSINGRWLLIESFKNAGQAISAVFKSIGDAYREIFFGDEDPIEKRANQLFNLIAALHRFSEELRVNEETADQFKRTFKGVFAILDIVLTLVSGPVKIAFELLGQLLGAFNIPILEFTAGIGDAVVGFRDWLDSVLDFTEIFAVLAPMLKEGYLSARDWAKEHIKVGDAIDGVREVISGAIKSFRDWIDSLKEAKDLPKEIADGIITGFKRIPQFVADIIKALRSIMSFDGELDFGNIFDRLPKGFKIAGDVFKELGLNLIEALNNVLSKAGFKEISVGVIAGLANGIRENASQAWNAFIELATQLIDKVKAVFGINSPSTVFYAIGGFLIAGLINGLSAGEIDIGRVVGGLAESIVNIFKSIDLEGIVSSIDLPTIISGLMGYGIVKSFLNISKAVKGAGDMFSGIGELMESTAGVVEKFGGVLKSFSTGIKAKAIKDIAIAIGILAGSVLILSFIDPKKLWNAVGVVAALAAVLGILFFAMNKIGGSSTDPKELANGIGNTVKIGGMLVGLGVALLLIAATLKIIEGIDPDKAAQAFGGLGGLIVAIIAVLAGFGQLVKGKSATNIAKLGPTLLLVSAALLIMSMVVKRLGELEEGTLKQGLVCIGIFSGLMLGMIAMSKLAGKKIGNVGPTIARMALSFMTMAFAVKILGSMDRGELIQGGIAIAAFVGLMVGMVAMTQLVSDKRLDDLGGVLKGMGVAMLAMAVVVKIIGGMETGELIKGTLAVTAFAGIIAGLIWATKLAGDKSMKGVASTLIAASVAIGILAAIAILLGFIKTEYLVKGIVAVGLLGGLVAAMIWATKGATDAKGNLIAMTAAIGVMAVAIVALSLIQPAKLAAAVLALSAVIGMFTLLVKVSGAAKGSIGTLIVMTVAIGLMGTLLLLLARMPVKQSIGAAVALSLLMGVMTGVMMILSKITTDVGNVITGVFGLLALAVPLLAFTGILALMSNVKNATENAKALAILASVLTLLLIPLSIIGAATYLTGGATLLGIVALLAMAVPMVAFVGILALMEKLDKASENAKLLTKLMQNLTAMLVVLAIVGPFALVGVGAMAALVGLIGSIGLLATAIGILMDKFPKLEEFLDTGIPILEKLAYALGSMVGNLFAGFSDAVMQTLPNLGQALSDFMANVTPFVDGIKMVDSSVLEGARALAGAVILLAGADLYEAITSFLQGGSSFSSLGTELSDFMTNAKPFFDQANLLNIESMEAVRCLGEMIVMLTASNIKEGLTSWITGGSSLSTFGAQLPQFGSDIAAFVKNLGVFDEATVVTVRSAASCITELAKAGESMNGQADWAVKLFGDNSLATFSSQLPQLGTDLSDFAKNLGTFDDAKVATIKCASEAIKVLAEAAGNIPNEGGMWASIFGDNSLSSFGEKLPGLGEDLAGFAKNLGTFDDATVTTVKCAADSIAAMAKAAEGIDGQSEWAAKIFGDNSLATFGDQLPGLGEDLAGFAENLGTFDEAKVSTVKQCVNALKAFASLAQTDLASAKNNLGGFGDKLPGLGTDIGEFISNMPDGDSISSAVKNFKKVLNTIKEVDGGIAKDAEEFTNSLGDIGEDAVSAFVKAFNNTEAKTDVKDAAKTLGDKAVEGVEAKEKAFKSACKDLVSAGAKATKSENNYNKFKKAGKYLVEGFVEGIDENTFKAEAEAAAMAKAALTAAEEALDEQSPSKETFRIGKFFVLGFSNAINEFTSEAGVASIGMAEKAKAGLSDAISKVKMAVDGDLDLQPTIRPTVDLSEVKTGTAAISNMFQGQSLAFATNVGPVSAAMTRRAQATTNADVVAELSRLGKKLDNARGDSYSINGVNYTEAGDVPEAIKTIVRAAKLERRT